MKYPKSNGEKWDALRRKRFDELRKLFKWEMKHTAKNKRVDVPEEYLDIIAWNLAFLIVTEK